MNSESEDEVTICEKRPINNDDLGPDLRSKLDQYWAKQVYNNLTDSSIEEIDDNGDEKEEEIMKKKMKNELQTEKEKVCICHLFYEILFLPFLKWDLQHFSTIPSFTFLINR